VRVVADGALDVVADGEAVDVVEALRERLGNGAVDEIDVYEEHAATTP